MNKKTISRKKLVEAGYTEYKKNHYQKKVTDCIGIKYYINCISYTIKTVTSWEFNVQFETSRGAVNIELVQWFNDNGKYSQNTIQDAEKYFEKAWKNNGLVYYEKFIGD